jgi:hypothetical protein
LIYSIFLFNFISEFYVYICRCRRFVIQIKNDPRFSTEDEEFCCKLPYTTNGNIGGLAITKKHSIGGLEGILSSLRQWVEGANSSLVLGIIPEVIIQPYILNNSEAKVLILIYICYFISVQPFIFRILLLGCRFCVLMVKVLLEIPTKEVKDVQLWVEMRKRSSLSQKQLLVSSRKIARSLFLSSFSELICFIIVEFFI